MGDGLCHYIDSEIAKPEKITVIFQTLNIAHSYYYGTEENDNFNNLVCMTSDDFGK